MFPYKPHRFVCWAAASMISSGAVIAEPSRHLSARASFATPFTSTCTRSQSIQYYAAPGRSSPYFMSSPLGSSVRLESLRLFSKKKDDRNVDVNDQTKKEGEDEDEEEKPREQSDKEYKDKMVESFADQVGGHPAVERVVHKWIREIIVGLNLCPFAEKTLRPTLKIEGADQAIPLLTTAVIKESDDVEVLSWLYTELLAREHHPGTSIVICPYFYPNDFDAFMARFNILEQEILPEAGLDGVLQVVPFHPKYRFEGSDPDGVDNWTNRSPYPIVHILREDEVSKAVDSIDGDASKIWKRNVDLLEAMEKEMGKESIERLYQYKLEPNEKKQVQELLKNFRFDMSRKSN